MNTPTSEKHSIECVEIFNEFNTELQKVGFKINKHTLCKNILIETKNLNCTIEIKFDYYDNSLLYNYEKECNNVKELTPELKVAPFPWMFRRSYIDSMLKCLCHFVMHEKN